MTRRLLAWMREDPKALQTQIHAESRGWFDAVTDARELQQISSIPRYNPTRYLPTRSIASCGAMLAA